MSRPLTARYQEIVATVAIALPVAIIVIGTALLAAGCSSPDAATDLETSTSSLEPMAAEELATAVLDTYSEAMQELVALLKDKPGVTTALPQVEALQEDYIQKMVTLGEQRETLSESDKAQVNSLEQSGLFRLGNETWYEDYNSLWNYYFGIDLELANLIASFNTLTQYSDFELLAKNAPDEAARLGVTGPQ